MRTNEPVPVPRGSYCTRCLAPIPSDHILAYIQDNHLCTSCADVSEEEVMDRIRRTERGSTVPEG